MAVGRLRASVEVKDRQFTDDDEEVVYPECFLGSDAVKWMVEDPSCPVSNSVEVSTTLPSDNLVYQCVCVCV